MKENTKNIALSEEILVSKIYVIRGQKVMIDRDLAELYGVETKVLKQAVKRNIDRFPSDFMFEMTKDELQNWRSQFVTSNSDKMGLRYSPFYLDELMEKQDRSITRKPIGYLANIQKEQN